MHLKRTSVPSWQLHDAALQTARGKHQLLFQQPHSPQSFKASCLKLLFGPKCGASTLPSARRTSHRNLIVKFASQRLSLAVIGWRNPRRFSRDIRLADGIAFALLNAASNSCNLCKMCSNSFNCHEVSTIRLRYVNECNTLTQGIQAHVALAKHGTREERKWEQYKQTRQAKKLLALQQLDNWRRRRRSLCWSSTPLTATMLMNNLQHWTTLVAVNSV